MKFHDQKDVQKKYLIDFWVLPQNGQLQVQETRIYKAPMEVEGAWKQVTRQPVPWWWIPASEHPGHCRAEARLGSDVGAGAGYPQADAQQQGCFHSQGRQDRQGPAAGFVDTHQPVRQLDENGHYFACTDFRAVGTKDQIYACGFLAQREERRDDGGSGARAQGARAQGWCVDSGGRVTASRIWAIRTLYRNSIQAALDGSCRGAAPAST